MAAAFVVLLLLALALGGIGFAGGLFWLVIIAAALLIVSLFTGYRGYAGRDHHHHHA